MTVIKYEFQAKKKDKDVKPFDNNNEIHRQLLCEAGGKILKPETWDFLCGPYLGLLFIAGPYSKLIEDYGSPSFTIYICPIDTGLYLHERAGLSERSQDFL